MRYFAIILLQLLFNSTYGQRFTYPSIKAVATGITEFIPKGWIIYDSVSGDLNKDAVKDLVLVLQHSDSVQMLNNDGDEVVTQPRILLILFKSKSGNRYNLQQQSNTFILQHEHSNMDDPFVGITIEKGLLMIQFHLFYNSGSWYTTNSTYKFRHNNNAFVLIGAELSTIHRATLDFEDHSFNFLTKKHSCTKGNEGNNTKKTTVTTMAHTRAVTLSTFAQPFTLQIDNAVYL